MENLSHSSVYGSQKKQQVGEVSMQDGLQHLQKFARSSFQVSVARGSAQYQNRRIGLYNPEKTKMNCQDIKY